MLRGSAYRFFLGLLSSRAFNGLDARDPSDIVKGWKSYSVIIAAVIKVDVKVVRSGSRCPI